MNDMTNQREQSQSTLYVICEVTSLLVHINLTLQTTTKNDPKHALSKNGKVVLTSKMWQSIFRAENEV